MQQEKEIDSTSSDYLYEQGRLRGFSTFLPLVSRLIYYVQFVAPAFAIVVAVAVQ